MKFFLLTFLILLALAVAGILLIVFLVGRAVRYFLRFTSGPASGEEYERMANKYYRRRMNDRDRFSEDYFEGTAPEGGGQQRGDRAYGQRRRAARTVRTGDGVTIVDHRDPDEAGKKIFAKDEGEYVDFTEN